MNANECKSVAKDYILFSVHGFRRFSQIVSFSIPTDCFHVLNGRDGPLQVQGLMISTPVRAKSRSLRVTTVRS